jgi:hypothetical protein
MALDRTTLDAVRGVDRSQPTLEASRKSSTTRFVFVIIDPAREVVASAIEDAKPNGIRLLGSTFNAAHEGGWGANPDIELLRLRALDSTHGNVVRYCRCSGIDDGLCCRTNPIDKHRLDVALSAGRHAAERAKLAGVGLLVGLAPRLDPAMDALSPPGAASGAGAASAPHCFGRHLMADVFGFDPYDILGCPRFPEIAALVGVAIAGAQMGVPLCLPGPLGELVARAAAHLNPGVDTWFDPMPAGSAIVGQAPAIPCVRCAT